MFRFSNTHAIAALAAVAISMATPALAHSPNAPPDNDPCTGNEDKDRQQCDFHGLSWGAGISVTFDLGGLERINDAEVVAGVVRVNDEDDVRARIMLESHYFFTPGAKFGLEAGDWGHGPFVAIQPGTDDIVEAAALGWMVGFRQGGSDRSFNIGLGIAVDPNVRTLGDGIERNQPLPVGETAVRYREEAQYGVVLLFSQSF